MALLLAPEVQRPGVEYRLQHVQDLALVIRIMVDGPPEIGTDQVDDLLVLLLLEAQLGLEVAGERVQPHGCQFCVGLQALSRQRGCGSCPGRSAGSRSLRWGRLER